MSSDTGAPVLPSNFYHIGIVVKDIDKAIEWLSSTWGLGPWQVGDYSPQMDELMIGEPVSLKIIRIGKRKYINC